MRGELRVLSRDVRLQGQKIDKLEAIVTKQAVQDQRLFEMDRKIEEMRHGRGLIDPEMWGKQARARGS
jgi:hypothetical protein